MPTWVARVPVPSRSRSAPMLTETSRRATPGAPRTLRETATSSDSASSRTSVSVPEARTPNSSPPRRKTSAPSLPTWSSSALATSWSTRSPVSWPSMSLTSLNPSRSRVRNHQPLSLDRDDGRPPASSSRRSDSARRLRTPVSGSRPASPASRSSRRRFCCARTSSHAPKATTKTIESTRPVVSSPGESTNETSATRSISVDAPPTTTCRRVSAPGSRRSGISRGLALIVLRPAMMKGQTTQPARALTNGHGRPCRTAWTATTSKTV